MAHVKRRPLPEPGSIPAVLGMFESEVRLYREIAPVVGVRVPSCHKADSSATGTVLELEDLSDWEAGLLADGSVTGPQARGPRRRGRGNERDGRTQHRHPRGRVHAQHADELGWAACIARLGGRGLGARVSERLGPSSRGGRRTHRLSERRSSAWINRRRTAPRGHRTRCPTARRRTRGWLVPSPPGWRRPPARRHPAHTG